MKMILSGHILSCFIIVLFVGIDASDNIAFELSDLTRIMSIENNGEFQLEAFKSVNNDKIMKEANQAKYSRLFWVSLGYPRLLKTASWHTPSIYRIFHENKEGFYVYIQTLTQKQRELLLTTANMKYNVNITAHQIVHLVLEKFSCNIQLSEMGKRFLIRGEVTNFHVYPIRMDFMAPLGSRERRLFETELEQYRNGSSSIRVMCSVASPGQRTRVNTLTITSKSSQELGIKAKLFGPSRKERGSVYVTRNQMNDLSLELYSRLSIVEEYRMPEHEFSEAFVQEFIKQMAQKGFSQVSFEKVLSTVSKYTLDVSDDLKPDIVKRDMGKIFKIENTNNKSHIIVDEEQSESTKDENSSDVDVSAKLNVPGIFDVSTSVKTVKAQSKEWSKGNKSLKDQLRELNRESTDNIEWTIEGTKVVPKSVNVAKIDEAKIGNTLRFERIRRYITDAPFQRKFSLYTHSSDRFYQEKLEKVNSKWEKSLQVMFNKMVELHEESEDRHRNDSNVLQQLNSNVLQQLKESEDRHRNDSKVLQQLNSKVLQLLKESENRHCNDSKALQLLKESEDRRQSLEDNLQFPYIPQNNLNNNNNISYPPALPRMIAMEGKKGYYKGNFTMCSPRGDFLTTSDQLYFHTWKRLLTTSDGGWTWFPDLILPTFMGGGILSVRFSKGPSSSWFSLDVHFHESPYNKQNVKLPFELGVSIYFFQIGSKTLLTSAEGREEIKSLGVDFRVFIINKQLFNPDKKIAIHLRFSRPM